MRKYILESRMKGRVELTGLGIERRAFLEEETAFAKSSGRRIVEEICKKPMSINSKRSGVG